MKRTLIFIGFILLMVGCVVGVDCTTMTESLVKGNSCDITTQSGLIIITAQEDIDYKTDFIYSTDAFGNDLLINEDVLVNFAESFDSSKKLTLNEYFITGLDQYDSVGYGDDGVELRINSMAGSDANKIISISTGLLGELKINFEAKKDCVIYLKGSSLTLKSQLDNLHFGVNINSEFEDNNFQLNTDDKLVLVKNPEKKAYSATIILGANSEKHHTYSPIKICDKELYNFGGAEVNSPQLSSQTKFSFSFGEDAQFGTSEKRIYTCEMDSCEYNGYSGSTGGKLVATCNINFYDDSQVYPKFSMINTGDVKGLKFEHSGSDITFDGILGEINEAKIYPFDESNYIQLVNNNFKYERFGSGINPSLTADKFYVGDDKTGYLVQPTEGKVTLSPQETFNDILKVEFENGGSIKNNFDYSLIDSDYATKEKIKLISNEPSNYYRIYFSNNRLLSIDCCPSGEYGFWTYNEGLVSTNDWENKFYGCQLSKEREGFLGLVPDWKKYEPICSRDSCEAQCVLSSEGTTLGTITDEKEESPATVVTPATGDGDGSVVEETSANDVAEAGFCGSADTGTEDWSCQCGMRSKLDPNFQIINNRMTGGMQGGLWASYECTKENGCVIGLCSGENINFYCCSNYAANSKPYAKKDGDKFMNGGRTTTKITSLKGEGTNCDYVLKNTFLCNDGIGSDWLQCLPETISSETYIWMRVDGCEEGFVCDPSKTCSSRGCECVSQKYIVGECDSSSDCESLFGEAYPCLNHECQDGARECSTEGDCARGDFCVGGFCVEETLAVGEECDSSSDCESLFGEAYPCVGGLCDVTVEVEEEVCISERDCIEGDLCYEGKCVDCLDDGDCDPELECNENFKCVEVEEVEKEEYLVDWSCEEKDEITCFTETDYLICDGEEWQVEPCEGTAVCDEDACVTGDCCVSIYLVTRTSGTSRTSSEAGVDIDEDSDTDTDYRAPEKESLLDWLFKAKLTKKFI